MAKQKITEYVEDFGLRKVPEKNRKGYFNMFMVLNAAFAAIAVVWGGGALGFGLDFINSLIAVMVGSTILAVIGSLTGFISAKSGGSTYLNWRYSFGRIPSGILGIALIMVTTGIGWYAVETWLGAIVISEIVPTGIFHNVVFNSLWFGVLMILVSFVGYRALTFITYIAFPQHVWLLIVGFFIALSVSGGLSGGWSHLLAIKPIHPFSLYTGITAAVGLYIAGALIAGDLTRYSKNGKIAVISWTAHMYIFYPILILGGVALVLVTGTYLVTQAMVDVGMGIAVLLIIVLGQIVINAVNLYSGSLSLINFIRIKRAWSAIINGIIGMGIAVWIAYTSGSSITPFENFISALGSLLPAAAGVVIADYFIEKPFLKGIKKYEDRYKFTEDGKYPEVNINGLVSFAIGGILGLGSTLGWFFIPGIASINALVISFVLYIIIGYISKIAKIRYEFGEYSHKKVIEKLESQTTSSGGSE
ncbi:MAG: cytosine permease [Candidatus Micrarchaeia archaeon]